MTQKLTLTFLTDPGHGWLGVPTKLVNKLDVILSPYSYVGPGLCGDEIVWCEEDCDAFVITKAMEAAGIEFEVKEQFSNRDAFVRNLARWSDRRYSRDLVLAERINGGVTSGAKV